MFPEKRNLIFVALLLLVQLNDKSLIEWLLSLCFVLGESIFIFLFFYFWSCRTFYFKKLALQPMEVWVQSPKSVLMQRAINIVLWGSRCHSRKLFCFFCKNLRAFWLWNLLFDMLLCYTYVRYFVCSFLSPCFLFIVFVMFFYFIFH